MKVKLKQELYSSPEAKVIEVKARQVLCTSEGQALRNTTEMGNVDDLG